MTVWSRKSGRGDGSRDLQDQVAARARWRPGSRATADGDRRAIELTATEAGQQAVLAWQATNAAVLHLALSTLPEPQRRALAAAVPAIDALARAIDRLADTPPADQDPG